MCTSRWLISQNLSALNEVESSVGVSYKSDSDSPVQNDFHRSGVIQWPKK